MLASVNLGMPGLAGSGMANLAMDLIPQVASLFGSQSTAQPTTTRAPGTGTYPTTRPPARGTAAQNAPAWTNRHEYFFNPYGVQPQTATAQQSQWGMSEEDMMAQLAALFGGGGGGGGISEAFYRDQLAEQMALAREQMAMQEHLANLARQQAQREMAAQMGAQIAGLQTQAWNQAMPWVLPKDTEYLPGTERGGPLDKIAQISGARHTPQRAQVAPPPSQEEMSAWFEDALRRFGG